MHFTYDDGPGKTVTGDDHFAMAENQATREWTGVTERRPTMFRVVSFTRADSLAPMRVVLEREGDDNNMPATLRETLTIGAAAFTILREVRPAGQEFTFRHQYRLVRSAEGSR